MPTYAYRCGACEHEFEAQQRFSDDPIRECPVCAGDVRRVIQPVGVVFKGSGWYINDSRKKTDDAKPATKPDGGDGKKPETAEAKKTDPKPDAAKTEAKPEAATAKTNAAD